VSTPPTLIASCQAGSEELAAAELRDHGGSTEVLAPGLLLVTTPHPLEVMSELAHRGALMFIRHLAPVEWTAAPDVGRLRGALEPGLDRIAGHSLNLHLRLFETPLTRADLFAALEPLLAPRAIVLDRQNPEYLCSIVIAGGRAFGGIAPTALCLSSWPGGEIRFRRDDGQISRAEFKLLEAIEAFGLTLRPGLRALDLGAAPGGWSRVLAGQEIEVIAVDPAALDTRCAGVGRITHHRLLAEEFIRTHATERFDLLLNDMRMDPLPSAEIMAGAAPLLAPSGHGLITLKLGETGVETTRRIIAAARERLARDFTIAGARQLFHNRHEVTLHLTPR